MKRYQGIILSIMVHLILILGLRVIQYEFPEPEPRKTWLELQDTSEVPLMSDADKRVKKQTRTKETNPENLNAFTQPTSSRPTPNAQKQQAQKSEGTKTGPTLGEVLHSKSFDSGDVVFNPNSSGGAISPQMRQHLQNFLPRDLEIGDVVALNTDQNLFFTFYRRMAEKIIWPWAQNVMGTFEKMRIQGQLGGTRKAWITVIEVVLDEKGSVVSTQPLQLSGTWDMDSAPTKAFKQAKNFPNPPQEMIEEDGFIRIRYKFIVYYTPRPDL